MADDDPGSTPGHRNGPEPVTLVAGVVAVAIALWSLFDADHLLPPQWTLAVGSIAVGAVMLIASMRTRRGP